jgi:hypothetical protein
LYLGNSRLTASERMFPWVVLAPQDRRLRREHPIITIEMDKAKHIAVNLDVLSEDRRVVARIKRNHFWVNPNNVLNKERPDRSTLVVTDQFGKEVLNIRYLNPHSIHLTGAFYVVGQAEPVVITDAAQSMGRYITFSQVCNNYSEAAAPTLLTYGDGTGNHGSEVDGK